jgi:putative (di)nucleoside polyphosphate hydrolase
MMSIIDLPYRKGVGMIVVNSSGMIFSGSRIDSNDCWQMPQGGMINNESIIEAALRELEEETSIKNVMLMKISKEWISYELPEILLSSLWNGRYRGQTQRWVLLKFFGNDTEININTKRAEFAKWKWSTPDQVINEIVEFKKSVYKKLFSEEEFGGIIRHMISIGKSTVVS